jgi:hypothetical protein
VQDGFLTIDFSPFSKNVDERMQRLQAARKMVVSDPGMLAGTPVNERYMCPGLPSGSNVLGRYFTGPYPDRLPELEP